MANKSGLSETLHDILDQYPSPRSIGKGREYDTIDTDPSLHELVTETARNATKRAISDHDTSFHVQPTIGQGTMGDIPYIPIQIPNETQTTQKGIYVVYLFDTEENTLYLTLNQGATEAQRASGLVGPPYAKEILTRHAETYRSMVDCPSQFRSGQAELTEETVVGDEPEEVSRAQEYNAGTIFYRSYGLDDLGEETNEPVTEDLNVLLDTYKLLIDRLYSVPEFGDDGATVWKISPEGGEDPYWKTWQQEDIASIDYNEVAIFKEDEEVDSPPEPHSSLERMAYNMQKGISEGDIIVAGAQKKDRRGVWSRSRNEESL